MKSNSEIFKTISKAQYDEFLDQKPNNIFQKLWEEILESVPDDLLQEAIVKGFTLIEIDKSMDLVSIRFKVINASPKLQEWIEQNTPVIICE